jgi:methionyl-tRNA synthetase
VWELVTALNREIDEKKPWVLFKEGRMVELDALLYDLCEGLRWLAILTYPFMPEKATEIYNQLGLDGEPNGDWTTELRWGGLAAETQTRPGAVLFARIDAPEPAA